MKKSIIQGGFLNVKCDKDEKGGVMYFNGKNILLGKNEFPHMLF
ncbi:hypothetical protein [Sphingobacterium sp. LRF_L2]